jgi:hypothetical protein
MEQVQRSGSAAHGEQAADPEEGRKSIERLRESLERPGR